MSSRYRSRSSRSGAHRVPRAVQYAALAVLGLVTVALVALAVIGRPGASNVSAAPSTPRPSATETAAPWDDEVVITIIGDSYTAGSSQNTGSPWPEQLAAQTGWLVKLEAIGGTGFATGQNSFIDRVDGLTQYQSDLVVIAGGFNDRTRDPSVVAALAAQTIDAVRETSPTADVLLLSPWSNGEPTPAIEGLRDAFADVAEEESVPFLDVTDYVLDNEIGEDGIHPTDAGHAAIAAQIGPALRELGLPRATAYQPAA